MKRIRLDVFRTIVYVTDNREEFTKRYKKLTNLDAPKQAAGLMYDHDDGNMYIGVFKECSGTVNTVVHEVTHCCLHICERIGMHNLYHEQEPMCYLMGYLTEEIFKAFPHLKGK